MSKKDIIDITGSPMKFNDSVNYDSDSFKLKNCNLLTNQKSNLPLQEIEENTMMDLNKIKKRKQKRRRKKKKDLASKIEPTLKIYDTENYESKKCIDSPNSVEDIENKVPASYSKLFVRQEELKTSVSNYRKAFAAYKVSTFFNFNSEFIKEFSESLSKVEQSVDHMEMSLKKAVTKELNKVTSTNETNQILSVYSTLDEKDAKISLASRNNGTQEELSPFSESKPLKIRSSRKSGRKRRIDFSGETPDSGKEKKKVRKCTVKNSGSPKIILHSNNVLIETFDDSSNNVKENEVAEDGNDSNSEPVQDGEYEVRKIQDYIRKQGIYYYQVSWRGYSSDDDTYEPADHLDGCEEALINFFYTRLKEKEKIKSLEELKSFPLPCDDKVKELIYRAFEKLVNSLPNSAKTKGIQTVTSSKNNFLKSKEQLQEEIFKLLSMRHTTLERYKKNYNFLIEQIAFKDLYQERLKQLADLREWERSINVICSDPAPISIENNVDLALPPLDFIYVNEYVPGPNVVIPSNPVAGCECKECNSLQKACCSNMMGSYFAYTKYGRLRVSLGTPIYECNKACSCSAECVNRVVQNGRKVALVIFRTSNSRGWGVKASEFIKKDQFVCEYVGEVITSEEAEQRGMKYDTMGSTYLFDLDYNKGDMNPYTVDAIKYGNVSHFINHSCDPNLVVFNVWINCLDPDLPKLALFAARDIKKGEEITFDYNSGSTRQIYIMDKLDGLEDKMNITPTKQRQDEEGSLIIPTTEIVRKTPKNRVINAGKTKCFCGSANCRKYFF